MAANTAYSLQVMIRAVDQFTAPIRQMQARMATFQRSTSEATKQAELFGRRLSEISRVFVGGGLLFGGSMLANAMAENVKQAGDFLVTLTMIQDTVGATADQMKQIQNVIQQTSGKTIFSVQDTANMALKLASSGLNAQQITQTLPIFSQFAEVQKLGKGTTPDEAITQALSSAHIVGAYTPEALSRFLDQYNRASFMQPGTTSEFADTFKYLAPSMQAIHASVNDELIMAALANRIGFLGSMGGTNAADAILRSIPGLFGGRGKTPSAQMRGLQELGLDKTIFDKNGNFLGVANFVAQLQKASAGKNPAQLAKIYHDIFGQQGMRIADVLSSAQGQDALKAIVAQMGNMKSISQMQEDTNQSPLGQIQQLQTNLQNLKLNVFIQMAQLLNPIVKYLNQIVDKVQVFADQHPKIMKYVAAFVAITGGVLALSAAVAGVIVLVGTLGAGGLAAVGAITGIAVVATLIIKYWGPIKSFFVNLWNGVKSTTQSAWQAIWGAIGPAMTSIWRTIVSACSQIVSFWRAIWPMLKQIALTVWPIIRDTIMLDMGAIWIIIKTIGTVIWATMKMIWTNIVADVKFAWMMIKDVIQLAWDLVSGIIVIGLDLLTGHWLKAWTDIKSYVGKIWVDIKTAVFDAWNGIVQLASTWYSSALSWGKNVVLGIWNGIQSLAGWLKAKISAWIDDVIPAPVRKALGIQSPSKLMRTYGQYVAQGMALGINDHTRLVKSASNQLANAAVPDTFDRYGVFGGSGDTYITININGANQSPSQIADEVMRRLGVNTRLNNMSRPIGPNRLVFN